MNKVKIAIIGIGNMGSVHAKSIAVGNINNLELVAVCDNDHGRIARAKEALPAIAFFDDYKELIKSGIIDAVLIATPHYSHSEIACFAFEHGLHVLTEKPTGVYTIQAEEMNAAAKKSGKVFGIMYNQRTSPVYRKVREMVKGGQLGQLKRFNWIITNWYRTQSYYDSGSWRATWAGEGGGVLINQCPHNLDLWQWIFGMPDKVRAFCGWGKYHNIEVEDDVTIYAEYSNGATAVFVSSTADCPGTNRLEITGDRGKLVVENGIINFWELSVPEREYCFSAAGAFSTPEITHSQIAVDGKETAHNGILQNFTNAILFGEELIAPGEEGINGLTISNAAYLSDWLSQTVSLPIDKVLFYDKLKERISQSKAKKSANSVVYSLQGSFNNQ
ncbi:MAG TPA: Gfo/Idh/MocA family oxidoreductase [Clostridia bacterium]|nr:Gfo/Idh/MocA family oxidoreductase [Clostridia bacterium]